MACTASVANRPEYCFSRRSTESGTVSSTSSVDAGGMNRLSGIPKSYATLLADSSKCGRRYALPVSLNETSAASTSSIWYLLAASTATDWSILPSRASPSSTATTTDSASVLK